MSTEQVKPSGFFTVNWMDGKMFQNYEGSENAATFAELSICINGINYTENKRVFPDPPQIRQSVYLCLYPMALWFTQNFPVLLFEQDTTQKENTTEAEEKYLWELEHNLAYAGEGFFWPPLRIFPINEKSCAIELASGEENEKDAVFYLPKEKTIVDTEILQKEILEFLHLCNQRLLDFGINNSEFQNEQQVLLKHL